MSVIPLVENRTFVTSQVEFAKGDGVLGSRVLIGNFDKGQLRGQGANISYDLRIGPRYRDHREAHPSDLAPGGTITLLPGSAVIVQTEEEVHFPRSMVGYVVPKVGMLQKGLSNTMSKVDPGYHGSLVITLFNLGKRAIPITRSEPFCALVIHGTSENAAIYDSVGKQIAGQPKIGFRFRLRQLHDKLEAHHTSVLAALVLVGLFEIGLRLTPVLMHMWHAIRRAGH